MKPSNFNNSRFSSVLMAALILVMLSLIGLTALRTYRNYSPPQSEFDWTKRGLSDFHYGTYYPSLAFRNRINPYSRAVMDAYPVSSPMRPCPPITFMLHVPFSLFELQTADVIFFTYNTLLLLGLAFFAVKIHCRGGTFRWLVWLSICCLLLISRPGHITLFTGYFTVELVLGTLVALHFARTRSWVSALGILIASSKPTYVLPLMALMLARKNYRAVGYGLILCTVAGIAGLGWLAADSSISEVVSGISEGLEEFHDDETEHPVNTWTRVDLMGMLAKMINWVPSDIQYLIGMFLIMIPSCVVIYRVSDLESDHGVAGLSSMITLFTVLLAIYHHSYDCLLTLLPFVGVLFFSETTLPSFSRQSKWLLAALISVPFLNYLSTQSARGVLKLEQHDFVWQLITLINGCCLTLALVILLVGGIRLSSSTDPHNLIQSKQS